MKQKLSPDTNRTLILIALLLAVIVVAPVLAQSYQDYSVTIVEIEGNKAADASLILSVSGLRSGIRLSSTTVQEAIHRLYGLGLFSDVSIDGEFAGGGIKIRIKVVEHPKFVSLKIDGAKKLDKKELKQKLTIYENQIISLHQIKENVEKIKDQYRSEGYYLAEVESEIKKSGESEIELTFKINEKEKVKIRAIEFTGNEVFDDGKLRGKMSNKPKGFLRSGTFKEDEYEEDKVKIIEFYNKKGFLDASIISDSIAVDPEGKRMVINIDVSEGDRYYFGSVTYSGNNVFKNEFLEKQMKFEPGDIYNSEKFEESVSNIYGVYYDDGYIHARVFDQVQTVDSILQINLEISEGTPAHINKVNIVGNHRTKEKVIRRELFSRPGQVFRRSVLMRSIRNVMVLNYFANVEPDISQLPNGDVDLNLKVEEKPTGQVQAGAGYSDQDKLVGTLGLAIPNFRGNGQSVALDWAFGKRRNSISLSFTEPWLFDTPTSVGGDLFSLNRQYSTYGEEFTEGSRGVGFRIGRRLSWPDDYFKILGRYRFEDTRLYDFNETYRENHKDDPYSLLRYENEWQRTSAVSATVIRDSRDLSQFATSGAEISLTSEFSGGILGGNWRYHKHIFRASKFTRLWWKVVLATKMELGVIDSPKGDSKIPYTERFAPGGVYRDGMIRGYDDGSVGPRNDQGALLRGRSMLVYNVELQIPIIEQQIYGLLFADAGNAWLTGKAIKPFDLDPVDGLKKSYGAGFRLVIPGIGVIGFDFAYGFNNPTGADWKPHFQIGTTF